MAGRHGDTMTPPPFFREHGLRWLAHGLGLVPLAHVLILGALGAWGFNPIQFLVQMAGQAALNLTLLTLAVTPAVRWGRWVALARHRRTWGLYAFAYVVAHVGLFAVVDHGLNWADLQRQLVEKPFIWLGSAAALVMLALALTSTTGWMKRLGRWWKRLHRLIYPTAGLMLLHYGLALKGSLFDFTGDVGRVWALAALLGVLLGLRWWPRRGGSKPAA